jgi:hypothetical protein
MCYFKSVKFVNIELEQWLSLLQDIECVIQHAKSSRQKLV